MAQGPGDDPDGVGATWAAAARPRSPWGWLLARWRRDQHVRYLMVGAWNTLFGYLIFLLVYALLHERLHYLVIGVMAHVIAVINAFVCHRRIVFRSRQPWMAEFMRFNVAQLGVLASGSLMLWLLVRFAGIAPPIAQAIVTLAAVAIGYLAHRHFSFATR